MSDTVQHKGEVWNRGDLSWRPVGPIRVFYMSYFNAYYEDFASISDAAAFVEFLGDEYPDEDGYYSSPGAFDSAIDTRTGEDVPIAP